MQVVASVCSWTLYELLKNKCSHRPQLEIGASIRIFDPEIADSLY